MNIAHPRQENGRNGFSAVALVLAVALLAPACSLLDRGADESVDPRPESARAGYERGDVCSILGASVQGVQVPLNTIFGVPPGDVVRWRNGESVILITEPDPLPEQVAAIEAAIASDPSVTSHIFMDKEQMERDWFRAFGWPAEAGLLGYGLRLNENGESPTEVAARYGSVPGVRHSIPTSEELQQYVARLDQLSTEVGTLPAMTFGELLAGPYLFDSLHLVLTAADGPEAVDAVRNTLAAHPDVVSFRMLDEGFAAPHYRRMRAQAEVGFAAVGPFGDLESERPLLAPEDVRRSFHIKLRDPSQPNGLARELFDATVPPEDQTPRLRTDGWRDRPLAGTALSQDAQVLHHLDIDLTLQLALAVAASQQPEIASLIQALIEASPSSGLENLTDVHAQLAPLSREWSTYGSVNRWPSIVGEYGHVSVDAWAQAVTQAESIRNKMTSCGLNLCTVPDCVRLAPALVPDWPLPG